MLRAKINAGVSGHSFVCPLKMAFYLCEYVTTSKIVTDNRLVKQRTKFEEGKFTQPRERVF